MSWKSDWLVNWWWCWLLRAWSLCRSKSWCMTTLSAPVKATLRKRVPSSSSQPTWPFRPAPVWSTWPWLKSSAWVATENMEWDLTVSPLTVVKLGCPSSLGRSRGGGFSPQHCTQVASLDLVSQQNYFAQIKQTAQYHRIMTVAWRVSFVVFACLKRLKTILVLNGQPCPHVMDRFFFLISIYAISICWCQLVCLRWRLDNKHIFDWWKKYS